MQTAEIIRRLDAIRNEFLAFDPTHPDLGGGYRDVSAPADVRIARAVCWIEGLKRDLRGDPAGTAQAFPSDPATDSG